MTLLFSLPDSYENLVQTMPYGKTTITMDESSSALLSDQIRKMASGSSQRDQQGQGLAARGNPNQKGSSGRGKSRTPLARIECYKCHEYGHLKRDCPNPKKGKNKKQEASEASVASNSGDELYECFSVASSVSHEDDR